MKRGNATLLDDPAYKAKLAELEIDLLATEFTELRSLASAANGAEPGPESSILKLKGTEIQQRIQKLTVEAGGIYSAAWGKKPVGHSFAKGGMSGYLASRAYTNLRRRFRSAKRRGGEKRAGTEKSEIIRA